MTLKLITRTDTQRHPLVRWPTLAPPVKCGCPSFTQPHRGKDGRPRGFATPIGLIQPRRMGRFPPAAFCAPSLAENYLPLAHNRSYEGRREKLAASIPKPNAGTCSPVPFQSVRDLPGAYRALMHPTPPPLSSHLLDKNNVTSIISRMTYRNKGLTCSQFSASLQEQSTYIENKDPVSLHKAPKTASIVPKISA
jgi:hypothetical protein